MGSGFPPANESAQVRLRMDDLTLFRPAKIVDGEVVVKKRKCSPVRQNGKRGSLLKDGSELCLTSTCFQALNERLEMKSDEELAHNIPV